MKQSSREREICYEVTADEAGMRLDLYLNAKMVWRSRSSIRKLLDNRKVCLKECAGEAKTPSVLKPSARIRTGDVYGVILPKPRRETDQLSSAPDLDVPVLYEDDWIVVVNKLPGIPVHPGGRLLGNSIITSLNETRARGAPEEAPPLKLCHRLDLETSGVLLVSKDPCSMPRFTSQFEFRKVKKEYLALVHGEVEKDRSEIDLPIGPAKGSKVHLKQGVNYDKGLRARTGIVVERRFNGYSLVRLRLFTGRHHQLRVHLSAIGHPIVGDKVYGVDEELFIRYHHGKLDSRDMARLILPRQALHASRLTIYHFPLDREMTLEAPLPADMAGLMETLEQKNTRKS